MSPVPEFIGLLKEDALGVGEERIWGHDCKYCSGEKETKCHSSVKSHWVNMGPRHGNKVRAIHSQQKKWALQLVMLVTTLACAPDKFPASQACQFGPKLYVFLIGTSKIKVYKVDLLGIYSKIYASRVISQSTELLFCASMWFYEAAKLYFNRLLYFICHLAEMYR